MESDRLESLQGSKMESDRPESLQGSKMESARLESLQGSKMESDRPESLQGSKMESARLESLQGSKMESDRLESLQGSKMESARLESLQGSKMESARPESLQGSKMESARPESVQGSKMESARPESLRGASSLNWGSDEVHELECGPCGTGGISRKGVFFCHTCREYLCKACKGHHENLKITKKHTIVSCELLCGPCISKNVKREPSHYCEECSEYLCDTCKDVHGALKMSRNHTVLSGAKMPKHFNITDTDIRHGNIMWLDKRIRSISKVNIRIPDDSTVLCIWGCCVMSDGQVVLCDWINYQIKLLDSSYKLIGNLKLPARPVDISVLNDTEVIITLPHERQLLIVSVTSQLRIIRTIQLDKPCLGVDVSGGEIYITCEESEQGEIRILDMSCNERRRISLSREMGTCMVKTPWYIAVSAFSGKIFIADVKTEILTCLTSDGQLLYQYKEQMLGYPVGILVDSADNVLLCYRQSHTIVVITPDGRKHGTLLSHKDGIKYPRSLAYRARDNTVMVGCDDADQLACIQLK